MSTPIYRMAMLLAAARFTDREIMEIQQRMASADPYEIIELIKEYREQENPISTGRTAPIRMQVKSDHNWSVGERVERLLKIDAGLSSREAVKLLSSALVAEKLIHRNHLPDLSKKSFSYWADKLSLMIDPKELLRVATQVHNQVVGNNQIDWLRLYGRPK